MTRCLRSVLLCVAGLAAGANAGVCPVSNCGLGSALLQANATVRTARAHAGGASHQEKADGKYEVDYTPGHFICNKCDASACKDCSILCDLRSCIGEFYTQECWCNRESMPGQETRLLCDPTCSGGLCDAQGQTCARREDACKPWWWCGAPPPKAFLQRGSSQKRLLAQGQAAAGSRRSGTGSLAQVASQAADAGGLAGLSFRPSKFVCRSGALPPKVRDPATFLWVHQGYIVLDQNTCEGDTLSSQCYCWDNFRNLMGKDPLTSEFMCDSECGLGPCEGRACGRRPPEPPRVQP
eukprot:CAMPEP_0195110696 /NCGR_PEP_ID=MMETSP0448-20130528/93648_1 /TAXON_ID=66468 /ORGANISM="Heterocapsa triquestra, Strain CCMP 448" /LENGTH=294 /DNA_ID=CAMNT_0040147419 /DNA_START=95 /DNA_END=976 /DNA_ORIENTATION=-